jgi:hypothetical protein
LFYAPEMDWAGAIEINRAALSRIVAALIAMVGFAEGGAAVKLSRPFHRAVMRVLVPVESALRRLIVIAARGVVVKPRPPRPAPAGLVRSGKRNKSHAFQLFDSRKRFGRRHNWGPKKPVPRVRIIDFPPLVPLFQRRAEASEPEKDDSISGLSLARRLAAAKRALEDLPRQAKRLVRQDGTSEVQRSAAPGPPARLPQAAQPRCRSRLDRMSRPRHPCPGGGYILTAANSIERDML